MADSESTEDDGSTEDKVPAKTKKKRGRPPHQPTPEKRETVRELSAEGVPQYEIARRIDISKGTLVKYYRDELDEGQEEAVEELESKAFELAMESDNAHHLHWMLERLAPEKWSRKAELDVTTDGEPLGGDIVTYLPDNGRGRGDDGE